MLRPYKILDVVHSGRKGIRGERVTAEKYNDLIGSTVLFDIDELGQFRCMNFMFKNHPIYEFWTTSETLSLGIDKNRVVHVETANSIYTFEPLFED